MGRRRRLQTQTPDRQLDLFNSKPPSACGATPGWNSLPQQTRCALIGLVTRLLVDHADFEVRDRRSGDNDL